MAKGIDINGQLSGRRGGVVYYRRNGKQISRAKSVSVANPQTNGQALTRCAMSTVMQAQSALRNIVDHSWPNVKTGAPSLAEFTKINLPGVRAFLKTAQSGQTFLTANMVQIKGSKTIQPYPYVISRGAVFFEHGAVCINGTHVGGLAINAEGLSAADVTAINGTFSTQADYAAKLGELGLIPGDQLSCVVIIKGTQTGATYGDAVNKINTALAARVTFVSELPENFSGTLINTTTHKFNPALIERQEGNMLVDFETRSGENLSDLLCGVDVRYGTICAAALVRSQVAANGDYIYSSEQMWLQEETLYQDSDIYWAIESYKPSDETSAGDGSKLFLDNPARPFGKGQ